VTKKIVLVDGKNFGFRYAYAHIPLHSSDGFPTGMLHGGMMAMKRLTEKLFPKAAVVFCWDGKGKTWRHQTPPFLYKANRRSGGEMPLDVKKAFLQFPKLCTLLHTILKFKHLRFDNVEADDLIGLCCTVLRDKYEIVIVSTDQDFYQLVDQKISVFSPKRDKLYGVDDVFKEFGVWPKDWVRYRALTGDASDNLPGAPGIGPVRAKEAIIAGLNPGLPFGMNKTYVQSQYKSLEPKWELIHYCWRMSRIALSFSHLAGCVSSDAISLMASGVNQLYHYPYRGEYGQNEYQKLLKFLGQYELREALKDRNYWFTVK